MMPPASAMLIKSSMLVGNIENAQAYSPLLTSFSSSAVPRMPPTKLMRLLVRGSSMPKIGARTCFCSSVTSSLSIGSLTCGELVFERERVPLAVNEPAKRVFARRRGRPPRIGVEHFFQLQRQLVRREAVQIFQHAVVGQNLHLVVRKNHGEKLSAVARAVARLKNARRRRAAMMAVGDVEKRNLRELRFDKS